MGSAVLSGLTSLDDAYVQTDRDGVVLIDELKSIGFVGEVVPPLKPHAHVELHIEQGPILGCVRNRIGTIHTRFLFV